MTSKKMQYLNPQIFFTGVSIAFWSSMLTPILVS